MRKAVNVQKGLGYYNTINISDDSSISEVLSEINNVLKINEFQRETGLNHIQEYDKLKEEVRIGKDKIEFTKAVGNLLNNVLDGRLNDTIEFITNTINDALKRVFPKDQKTLSMKIKSHKETYPQLNVKLMTPQGELRVKNQEGTGVKQIISVLYILCLIYVSGGRRFVFLDEVLDGLHEDVMLIMDEIFKIFIQDLGFTIVVVEHGYPVQEKTSLYKIIRNDFKSEIGSKVVY